MSLGDRVALLRELDEVRVVPVDIVLDLEGGLRARRASGEAGDHHEVVWAQSVRRHPQVVRGLVRDVVGRRRRGFTILADVRAIEREVTGMARPLPVVDLTAVV